jgi:hypothetical protein
MSGRRRLVAAGVMSAAVYTALRRLGRTYGATSVERRRRLPGDDLVVHAPLQTTHAITVDALPEQVWPWLAQMGWGRGQWYTARWVDRLLFPANGPSAERIQPELQHLEVGERIPDGPPETNCYFVIRELEPNRHLVLHSTEHLPPGWAERFGASIDFSWAFVLESLPSGKTRFIFRSRARVAPTWVAAFYKVVIVPADFVMSRQMLRGVKERAERTTPAIEANSGSGWRSTRVQHPPKTSVCLAGEPEGAR